VTLSAQHELSALLLGDYKEERPLIREVFRDLGWNLFEAADWQRAMQCLDRNPVQVVIAESDVHDGNWKRLLQDLRERANPPQLVVTSRLADDALWSEVLNMGGYDVMALPLRRVEVERVIASAHRHYDFAPLTASA
jgi:DNA-binding response OmpR family regulator